MDHGINSESGNRSFSKNDALWVLIGKNLQYKIMSERELVDF